MTDRKLKYVIFLILAAALGVTNAAAQGEGGRADKTLSPYFFVQGDPGVDRLPLKDTTVDVAISGVIADVRVVQTYRNEGTRPINASYVFPASTRAAATAKAAIVRSPLRNLAIRSAVAMRRNACPTCASNSCPP